MYIRNPLIGEIIVGGNGAETILIRNVLKVNGEHYAVFLPLVTQQPLEELIEEVYEDYADTIEVLGIARIEYDYDTFTATLYPLDVLEDWELIETIVGQLGYELV